MTLLISFPARITDNACPKPHPHTHSEASGHIQVELLFDATGAMIPTEQSSFLTLWPTGPRQYFSLCTVAWAAFIEAFRSITVHTVPKRLHLSKVAESLRWERAKRCTNKRREREIRCQTKRQWEQRSEKCVIAWPVHHTLGSEGCETWVGKAKSMG